MSSLIQVLPHQVIKKSFYTFEDIDLRESYAKLNKNQVELWEQIEFKSQKSVLTVFLGTLKLISAVFYSACLQKWKVHLLSFKTSPYRKILTKNYS